MNLPEFLQKRIYQISKNIDPNGQQRTEERIFLPSEKHIKSNFNVIKDTFLGTSSWTNTEIVKQGYREAYKKVNNTNFYLSSGGATEQDIYNWLSLRASPQGIAVSGFSDPDLWVTNYPYTNLGLDIQDGFSVLWYARVDSNSSQKVYLQVEYSSKFTSLTSTWTLDGTTDLTTYLYLVTFKPTSLTSGIKKFYRIKPDNFSISTIATGTFSNISDINVIDQFTFFYKILPDSVDSTSTHIIYIPFFNFSIFNYGFDLSDDNDLKLLKDYAQSPIIIAK